MTAAPAPAEVDNSPATVFDELMAQIADAMTQHPRSLQTQIGPSEYGVECDRALINKLAGTPEPGRPPAWKPEVGTAVHNWLEDTFRKSPGNRAECVDGCQRCTRWVGGAHPRYLLEQEVTVGTIGGVPLTGKCDLFDVVSGTVVDWKGKGKTTLRNHRLHGPGLQYRRQAQSYGLGWANAGHFVRQVMIVFFPRDGEMGEWFFWSEPFDEKIALAALDRANQLAALVSLFGLPQALALYPKCDDQWCRWCRDGSALGARYGHGSPNPLRQLNSGK